MRGKKDTPQILWKSGEILPNRKAEDTEEMEENKITNFKQEKRPLP